MTGPGFLRHPGAIESRKDIRFYICAHKTFQNHLETKRNHTHTHFKLHPLQEKQVRILAGASMIRRLQKCSHNWSFTEKQIRKALEEIVNGATWQTSLADRLSQNNTLLRSIQKRKSGWGENSPQSNTVMLLMFVNSSGSGCLDQQQQQGSSCQFQVCAQFDWQAVGSELARRCEGASGCAHVPEEASTS